MSQKMMGLIYLHSRPAVEIVAVDEECFNVSEPWLRHVMAFVYSPDPVLAVSCGIGTLAHQDL